MDLQIDLLAEHRHPLRSLNADAHLLAHHRQHRHLDLIPDHDALVGLARQNQHLGAPSSLPIGGPAQPQTAGKASIVAGPGESDPNLSTPPVDRPQPAPSTCPPRRAFACASLPDRPCPGNLCARTSTRSVPGCAKGAPTPGSPTNWRSPSATSSSSSARTSSSATMTPPRAPAAPATTQRRSTFAPRTTRSSPPSSRPPKPRQPRPRPSVLESEPSARRTATTPTTTATSPAARAPAGALAAAGAAGAPEHATPAPSRAPSTTAR